jgi:FkbM family methyltransferase
VLVVCGPEDDSTMTLLNHRNAVFPFSWILLFLIWSSAGSTISNRTFSSHHNKKYFKHNEYLKHLLANGQLYNGKSFLRDGLKYDPSVLNNANTTEDEKLAHCEYFTIHPFNTYRPYRQCLRTGYYELVSDIIIKSGSYGLDVLSGCNFLLYMWAIYGSTGHPGLFVDVGANIGTCSLLFAANGISAVAFELIRQNAIVFAKSILGNYPEFEDMILLYPYGVGEEPFSGFGYMQPNNMGNSMVNVQVPIKKRDRMVKEEIDIRRLDDMLWANRLNGGAPPTINVMKIDVQGYEYKALKGAEHLLQAGAINMILFENEKRMLNAQGTSCTQIVNYLQSFNFTIFDMSGNKIKESAECETNPSPDLIAKYIHSHY